MKQFWYFMLSTEDSTWGDWHGLFFHYDKNKNTDYKCLKEVKCNIRLTQFWSQVPKGHRLLIWVANLQVKVKGSKEFYSKA